MNKTKFWKSEVICYHGQVEVKVAGTFEVPSHSQAEKSWMHTGVCSVSVSTVYSPGPETVLGAVLVMFPLS